MARKKTRKGSAPTEAKAIEIAKAREQDLRERTESLERDIAKKRIGRPTKKPTPGERVPLGLRVTPQMKERLEAAAAMKGRSLSQEVEFRLEMSLSSDRQLILAFGGYWLSVIKLRDGLHVALPVGFDAAGELEDDLLPLKISEKDRDRLRNYFSGAYPPYDKSRMEQEAEIEDAGDAWLSLQEDIKRGK